MAKELDIVDEIAAESPDPSIPKETFEQSENRENGTASIYSVSSTITTADQAFEHAGYDPKIWEITESQAKSYQCPMKLGTKAEGFYPAVVELWGVSVKVKRKVAKRVTDAVQELLADAKWKPKHSKPPARRKPLSDPHMLFLGMYDHHFGKYGWEQDCGEDYDTDLACRAYVNGVDDLLAKSAGYNIEKIHLPIGQDFFQADNWFSTTHKGTPVDSDGRFQRTFRLARDAVVTSIDRCLQVAPVDVSWVPGNHDTTTSWYLFECLSAWFRSSKHVHMDEDTKSRKYVSYGENLLGLAHGDKIANINSKNKIPSLVGLMATEDKHAWAASSYREWLLGHFHKAGEVVVMTLDEELGIRARHLPSLSGTDKWHFDSGFTGRRACDGLLYSRTDGFAGMVSGNVRTS